MNTKSRNAAESRAVREQGILAAKDLAKLLDTARSAGYSVYAPQEVKGETALAGLVPGGSVKLDFENVKMSPKGIFLPQAEVICEMVDGVLRETAVPQNDLLLFGVRPCDARALTYLDKVFGEFGPHADPYYMARRAKGVIISLACTNPCETCFCTTVGSGPGDTQGSDVMACDLGGKLLFQSVSDKGAAFLGKIKGVLAPAADADTGTRDAAMQKAAAMAPVLDVPALQARLKAMFQSEAWSGIASTCLGCGLCTYLCPTCHCFDITDETDKGGGRRIRTWDSCQFSLFTMHASGHNPRPGKKERMRQRVLHKFQYTLENMDATFCVGCGRCVTNCPVNLDIRDTLKTLAQDRLPAAGSGPKPVS